MTHSATLAAADEQCAAALAAEIADDDELAAEAVDLNEVAPGRWQVVVYFARAPDRRQRAALARWGRFAIAGLPETDWVAKSLAELKPVRAGRFLVHGRHDRDRRRANDIAIEIEANQAFGSGHHGTTLGCLLAIEAIARSRKIRTAIDVGTGSGILAIAIARLARAPVLASDIDPLAVRIARDNARLNGVGGLVRAVNAAGLAGRAFDRFTPADLIVANILAGPLAALAPAVRRRLAPGGTVILSGLLPDQRARVVAAYRGRGLRLTGRRVVDGWLTVAMQKPIKVASTGAPVGAG